MKPWAPSILVLLLAGGLVLFFGAGVVSPPGSAERASVYPEPTISAESLERRAREITVRVRNRTCRGLQSGSGILLGETLLTNRHVVQGARNLEINTWDGRSFQLQTEEALLARSVDIAKLPISGIGPEGQISSERPEPGEELVVAGYPRGKEIKVVSGEFLGYVDAQELDELGYPGEAMIIEVGIDTGSSGGPILDAQGRVVGVIFAGLFPKKKKGASSAIAIPIDEAERLLRTDGTRGIGRCRYQIAPTSMILAD